MENARSLDVLADDLPAHHVFHDHVLHTLGVHTIIQSCHASRAREGGKPAADHAARSIGFCGDLSHQDIRPLRAAAEAALPHELGAFALTMRDERRMEHVVKHGRTAMVATLRAATDHDLEPAIRHLS